MLFIFNMRFLTSSEIEYLIDFIKPCSGINKSTAESICENNKNRYRKQLVDLKVKPSIIEDLKKELYKSYRTTLIQPGESVGILCAQSIGEKNTQTALNTFHKAGQSEKTMTEGVPRFEELLNATKNPKIINHKIFFNKNNQTIESLRKYINGQLKHITLESVTLSYEICLNKTEEDFYEIFDVLYNNRYKDYTTCIIYKLNKKKLYESSISLEYISQQIENMFADITCVFSPLGFDKLFVYINTDSVYNTSCQNGHEHLTEKQAIEIYLDDCVIPELNNITIKGINNIDELFFTKSHDNTWFVETNCYYKNGKVENIMKNIMALDIVNPYNLISNNVWEIYNILGIEAAKKFLINEFLGIMSGINVCHAILLVDRMTYDGYIDSISRYTLKNDSSGPFAKASFEESLDNFLNASIKGEKEPVQGISASIICGKRSNTGTGLMNLKIDTNFF